MAGVGESSSFSPFTLILFKKIYKNIIAFLNSAVGDVAENGYNMNE